MPRNRNNRKIKRNPVDIPLKISDVPETSSIRAIKYLTCQGGGMKGIGDVGAVKELERCGVLAQIEEVAGSSAGAIVATLIAIGCTADEIKQEMSALDFASFQDRDPGWIESTHLKDFTKGVSLVGNTILDKVNLLKRIPVLGEAVHKATRPIHGMLQDATDASEKIGSVLGKMEKVENIAGVALGFNKGVWKGDTLKNKIASIIARKTGKPNITFRELEALSKIEGSRFKGLTLTGTNLTTEQLEYYNARETPDMPIVNGLRISMSIPGAFKWVEENGDVKVDGGVLENLPDVFNKEPYISPETLNKKGGNREVFALSFVPPQEPDLMDAEKMKNGIDLVKACYNTKFSEKSLQKKYGPNIAYINTMGMDTLQMDASETLKQELIESGAKAVRETLSKILEKERNGKGLQYQNMPLQELIRRECALKHLFQTRRNPKTEEQLNQITIAIHELEISEEELSRLRKKEEARFAKVQALLDPNVLSDKALANLCVFKQRELVVTEQQLKNKFRQLKLAKNALQFNREELLMRFRGNHRNNEFNLDLQALKKKEVNVVNAKNKKDYIALKIDYDKTMQHLMQKYKTRKDELLANFFEDLRLNAKKTQFKMPSTDTSLWSYCTKDIRICIHFIQKTKIEMEKSKEDQKMLNEYSSGFSERTEKSKKHVALVQLKTELDKCIFRKTTLLTKIDSYLSKKSPKFSKILTPFLKLVGFVSFVCCLPLAIPCVSIAKGIRFFSKNEETHQTVDRFVDFFRWTDLDLNRKLRGFRNMTAECIKKLNDNYIQADKVEHSYLHRLHAHYLQNSGLKVEDIISRNTDETDDQYRNRVEKVRKSFEVEPTHERVLKVSNDFELDKKLNKNVSRFKMHVLKDVLKKKESVQDKKIEPKDKKTFADEVDIRSAAVDRKYTRESASTKIKEESDLKKQKMQDYIRLQNIKLINLEYLNSLDQKLQADPESVLTRRELRRYLESSKIVGRELSAGFRERHEDALKAIFKAKRLEAEKEAADKPKPGPASRREGLVAFSKEKKERHEGLEKGKAPRKDAHALNPNPRRKT